MTNLIKRLFKPSPMKLARMLAVAGGLAIATKAMEENDDDK